MKTVFITGAAGFLGSHLSDEMLLRGYRVIGFDNLSHGHLRNLNKASSNAHFSFHCGDVRNIGEMREAAGTSVDLVMHLAAFKIPRYGHATQTLLINSLGTQNALQLAVERRARFVITSTSDVYGNSPKLPFSEDSDIVLGPSTVTRWAYAASKLFDEHLVFATAEERGLSASVIRIFGSYGPRQHLSWWGGPQSVFIDAVLRNQVIPIHGDGLQTRSFTFVSDTVRGIADVGDSDHLDGELINIGSNFEMTILELARQTHELCEVQWPLRIELIPYDRIAGRPYQDVRRRVPDIGKAERVLSFVAKVPLVDGLRETIQWQRPFMNIPSHDSAEAKPEAVGSL